MRNFAFNGEPIAEGYIFASLAARLAAKTAHLKGRRAIRSVRRSISKIPQQLKTPA
jgi:hypothetical protein